MNRKVNFHCPWCPYALIHYRHQLCWPICIECAHTQYCSVSQSVRHTGPQLQHKHTHYSIDKSHIVGNSTPYAIVHALQFKVLVLSLEVGMVRVYFYCYCSIELHSLRTWCTDTSKHWHKNVELLDSQFLFLYIPVPFPLSLFIYAPYDCCSAEKKPLFVYFKKKEKPNWKKQIVSYGNFMMTFAFQTVHLVWIFFSIFANARMRSICINLNHVMPKPINSNLQSTMSIWHLK